MGAILNFATIHLGSKPFEDADLFWACVSKGISDGVESFEPDKGTSLGTYLVGKCKWEYVKELKLQQSQISFQEVKPWSQKDVLREDLSQDGGDPLDSCLKGHLVTSAKSPDKGLFDDMEGDFTLVERGLLDCLSAMILSPGEFGVNNWLIQRLREEMEKVPASEEAKGILANAFKAHSQKKVSFVKIRYWKEAKDISHALSI